METGLQPSQGLRATIGALIQEHPVPQERQQEQVTRKAAARPQRPLTAAERAQRILATRWASPWSRAGAPSRSTS
jgi:hypothetical protein